MKKIFLVAFLFTILSFESKANKTVPADSSVIYIYRVGQFGGAAANWAMFVDETKLCKLSNNKYIRVAVKPSKHTISSKVGGIGMFKKETELELQTETGGEYYVACNVKQSITRARLEMI